MGHRGQEFVLELVGTRQLLVHGGQLLPGLLQRTRLQVAHGIDPVRQRQRQQAHFNGCADLAGVHGQEHVRQVAEHHECVDQPTQQESRPGNHKITSHPQAACPGNDTCGKDSDDKGQRQPGGQT